MGTRGKKRVVVGRSRGATVLGLLLSVAFAYSCGQSSGDGARGQTSGAAGVSAAQSGAAGHVAGNSASAGSSSSAGTNGSAGGAGTGSAGGGANQGGMQTAGGTEPAHGGDSSSEGGQGGDRFQADGWACGSNARCVAGQACVLCASEDKSERICVPHPLQDPGGYATATAACGPGVSRYDECDGPEDCAVGKYCVAREGTDGFARCREQPSTSRFCCFACNALPDCTLCHRAADCAENELCQPNSGATTMGCHRAL